MSRRHRAEKREILPDPRFGDLVLSKFVNNVMLDGKKAVAERIVYGALENLDAKKATNDLEVDADLKAKNEGLSIFHLALGKIKPKVEVKSRRVGGATYQVPVEVASGRSLALAMRWLITAARKRSERTMCDRLAAEILDAANDRGSAVKKRDDTHKMAEANKAFAHYRW
ncbi:MAG: 30S ribosomal protein S7 [Alphaproteobacteria bacterium]|nr:30S ribosomal protein S7 [Alphaproteobacteria bacterium]